MKLGGGNKQVLLLLCAFLLSGYGANAVSYDYSATLECLANPNKPQYNGGIMVNPELNHGLKGWFAIGDAKVEHRVSGGNGFVVAHGRRLPNDSLSQTVHLRRNMLYTFSAWIQVSHGSAPVSAIFETEAGLKNAGAIVAESKCWSMLKGGLTVDSSGPAKLYFQSNITSVEIWVDSISLQPFTPEEWRAHQDESIRMMRKSKVRIQAVDRQGQPVHNATISFQQKAQGFPFGCAINKNILNNKAYQNWFTSRFKVTTFEDEMKWYSTEPSRGHEDYSAADAMLQFAKQHGISVRGHNVIWEDPKYQPGWVNSLFPNDLKNAVQKRISSIMSRYKGQLIAWDVVNENLHFSFYESKLGEFASAEFYKLAHLIDPNTPLFMNEFSTIEASNDWKASPARYLQKLRSILAYRGNRNMKMGIGLEAHFNVPNIPYMRSALDTLASTGLPIWLTELDVQNNGKQAQYLEQILREAHSHPVIKGIVMWSAWKPEGCYRMCLTDNNFRNLATGNVVDKLLHEWGVLAEAMEGRTDASGFFETSLFHGDYEIKLTHPAAALNSSLSSQTFKLATTDRLSQETTLLLHVSP